MNATLDAALYGTDLFGESMRPPVTSPVAQKFLVSPFSVLNAREGDWQERKRAWAAMGIRGEEGRNALSGGNGTSANSCYMVKRKDGTTATAGELHGTDDANCSSIFDPVLCELAYRWWSGEGAQILDPAIGAGTNEDTIHAQSRHRHAGRKTHIGEAIFHRLAARWVFLSHGIGDHTISGQCFLWAIAPGHHGRDGCLPARSPAGARRRRRAR